MEPLPAKKSPDNQEYDDNQLQIKKIHAMLVATKKPEVAQDKIDSLIKQLGDDKFAVRQKASADLFEIGRPAKLLLQKALKNTDVEIKHRAEVVLERLDAANEQLAKDLEPLVKSLGGAHAPNKIKANVEALMEIISPEYKYLSEKAKLDAMNSLSNIGAPAEPAVPLVKVFLKDENVELRQKAARTLEFMFKGAKSALPELIDVMKNDKDERVVIHAAAALGCLGRENAKEVIPALLSRLNDPSEDIRVNVMDAFGRMGPAAKSQVPTLIKVLKNDSDGVQKRAMLALGNIGPDAKDAVPVLIEVLGKHNDVYMRYAAATALGGIGPDAKDAVPALIAALKNGIKDSDYAMQRNVAETLGNIGPDAKAALPELKIIAAYDVSWSRLLHEGDSMQCSAKDAAEDAIEKIKNKPAGPRRTPSIDKLIPKGLGVDNWPRMQSMELPSNIVGALKLLEKSNSRG